MACLAECLSLGPPPDAILSLPPPPLPLFLVGEMAAHQQPCHAAHGCSPLASVQDNTIFQEVVEMPRHEPAGPADTWYLVLVTCSTAVLLVAALLALFLLKCKQVRSSCKGSGKSSGSNVLYGGSGLDSRVLWAALTPRGTRHFVADTYPHEDDENHYECVDPPLYKLAAPEDLIARHFAIEYEDPAPLIEGYDRTAEEYYKSGLESLRKQRPLVSSPTRIERPNLPPLNLQSRTLRRPPHSRRVSDANATEKGTI